MRGEVGEEFVEIELSGGYYYPGQFKEDQSVSDQAQDIEVLSEPLPLSLTCKLSAMYVAEACRPHTSFYPFRGPMSEALFVRYVVHHNLHLVRVLCLFALLALGFFEQPPWCWGDSVSCFNATLETNSSLGIPMWANFTVPHANLPLWSVSSGLILEVCCLLALLLCGPCVRLSFVPLSPQSSSSWALVKTAIYLVSLVDCLVSLGGVQRQWRLSPWMRPAVLIFFSSWTRRSFYSVAATLPSIASVLVFLAVLFLMLVWAAVLLFNGQPGAAATFGSFWRALRDLHVTLTTANFPDIMVPLYPNSSWTLLYYVAFFALLLYFLLPLLLASVYGAYREILKQEARHAAVQRRLKLERAFECLDVDHSGSVGFGLLGQLLSNLNYMVLVPYVNSMREQVILARLDQNQTQRILKSEFCDLVTALATKTKSKKPNSCARFCCAKWFVSPGFKRVQRFFLGFVFGLIIDFVVLLQIALMIYETVNLLDDEGRPETLLGIKIFDAIVVFIFVVEMLIKMFFSGWKFYWSQGINVWDGSVSIVSALATIVVLTPNAVNDPTIYRVFLFMRFARVFRFLVRFSGFRVLLNSYLKLLPLVSRAFVFIFGMYYLFALLGMQLWGGLIYPGSPALQGTAFQAAGYIWTSHWNDFGASMSTLFQLQIVNNWFVIMQGVESSYPSARAFFVVWWLVAVLFAVNILVALVIDSFVSSWKEERAKNPAFFHLQHPGAVYRREETEEEAGNSAETPQRVADLYEALGIDGEDVADT